jgi:hypothetical protein
MNGVLSRRATGFMKLFSVISASSARLFERL